MLTERENALRMIRHTGDAQWVPDDSKCLSLIFPSVCLERPPRGEDGVDWFGCKWYWEPGIGGHMQKTTVDGVPIPDITRWRETLIIPDLEHLDFAAAAQRELARADRENTLVTIMLESGPFERMHALLGFEDALIAMYDEPECFVELINTLADFRLKLLEKLIDAYRPDAFILMDDLGSERAPLISLNAYREMIKPCHVRMAELLHRHGCIYIQHVCGKMDVFIEDLIDAGVDVIHPLQDCNDQKTCLEKYADKVCFYGCLGRTKTFPNATEEQIRQCLRDTCDTFGPYRNFMIETRLISPRTTAWLRDELEKYGKTLYTAE